MTPNETKTFLESCRVVARDGQGVYHPDLVRLLDIIEELEKQNRELRDAGDAMAKRWRRADETNDKVCPFCDMFIGTCMDGCEAKAWQELVAKEEK